MPETEAPTTEYFQFEDITGKVYLYTESEIRSMGFFHRHSLLVLAGITLRSDGSSVYVRPACPICDFYVGNKPWLIAWRERRLWAVNFEALATIRRIEEEYVSSALVASSFGSNLPVRAAGLLDGAPPKTAK